jgi:hypothetical protein
VVSNNAKENVMQRFEKIVFVFAIAIAPLTGCAGVGEPGKMGDPGVEGPTGTQGPAGPAGPLDPVAVILNSTTPQSASFNISGDGIIGGNVGIATNGPATKLQIGAGAPDGRSEGLQFGTQYKFLVYPKATVNTLVIDANGDVDFRQAATTNNGSGRIAFMTAMGSALGGEGVSTERMRIERNGNVGIGTSTPSSKLDVNGFIQTQDAVPFSIKRYTGTTDSAGGVAFAPGVYPNQFHIALLSAQVLCRGGSGEARGCTLNYVDGLNISASCPCASAHYRATVIYSSSFDASW